MTATTTTAEDIKPLLRRVASGQDLTEDQSREAMTIIMAGAASDAQIGAYLTALRMKGESLLEIAGAVRAMRGHVVPIELEADGILDTCGTGGDGAGTFNISTAVSFVCAAAGATVAKHGNRAISSRVGSADVLEALGVRIDLNADQVKRCITKIGIGFMFAPTHHQALRHAAPARRQLGFRTMLNLLGPMTNPAGANLQLIGVYDASRVQVVAEVLRHLGTRRAMIVHGRDGLDEVSLSVETDAALLRDGVVTAAVISPEALGVERSPVEALAGGDAPFNADLIRRILGGEATGPPTDVVRLNAGCALWVAERADTMSDGVALATRLLDQGAPLAKLEALAAMSHEVGP